MKVPIAWLRRYVDLPAGTTSQTLSERLASLGFPVDSVEAAPALSGVFIGKLTAVEKHPNADRLSVCTVDVGGPAPLTIATAATNVATGRTVPVAIVGAHVLGHSEDGTTFDLHITPRKMRGVESAGMLCSAGELGLEPAWFEDGIMLLEDGLAPGADALDVLGLRDGVLDIEVTPNRVDALAIVGIARELAASLDVPLRLPEVDPAPLAARDPEFSVAIESPDCTRFVSRVFTGAVDGTSPGAMRVFLALAGQRPIGLLVDISNFVMLETGQPLHFYDAARIAGKRLAVRDARPGETLTTLDDAERTLDARALVVADADAALGLAGIKGGASSEISPETTTLVLEAATFSGPRIRRTAIACGLRTEASSRHEKGLPPGLADFAAARASYLLAELAHASARPPFAAGEALAPAVAVRIRPDDVERLIGIRVSPEELTRALRGLGFEVGPAVVASSTGPAAAEDAFDVRPPYWRADIAIVPDLVEEVARVIGFDRIESVMPPVFPQSVSSADWNRERGVAHAFAALGYREAITYALGPASVRERFVRAGIELPFASVEIRNPLSEDQRFMRFSLMPGLLGLAARHARSEPLRYFEIGHVFRGDESGAIEEIALAAWMLVLPRAASDAATTWRDAGFGIFKSETLAFVRAVTGRAGSVARADALGLHPGKTASVAVASDVAVFGAVDPRALAAFGIEHAVYFGTADLATLPDRMVPQYVAPSRYPAVERDFALVVAPDVDASALELAMRDGGGSVVTGVRVFDEYRGPQVGEGRKSLAVRVTLQKRDATLTDADVEKIVAGMLGAIHARFEATIRQDRSLTEKLPGSDSVSHVSA